MPNFSDDTLERFRRKRVTAQPLSRAELKSIEQWKLDSIEKGITEDLAEEERRLASAQDRVKECTANVKNLIRQLRALLQFKLSQHK